MITKWLAITLAIAVSPLWAQSCEPTVLSTTNLDPLGGSFRHVAVGDGLVIVASESAIRVLDVSDPATPIPVGELSGLDFFGIPVSDIEIVGSVAIYADASNFLRLIDLSDPTAPRLASDYHPNFEIIIDTDVSEGKLFSIGNSGSPNGITRLDIVDVSNPDAPTRIGSTDIGQFDCRSLVVEGSRAYAGGKFRNNNSDFISIVIFDVSNPSAPAFTGRQDFSTLASTGRFENVIDIAGANGVVFPLTRRDVYWMDTSPPMPQGRLTSPANAEWLAVESDSAWIYLSQDGNGISIYDRSAPAFPSSFPQTPCSVVSAFEITDIDSFKGLVYAIDKSTSMLHIFTFDQDGDGLLDDWELNGIPYTDMNGIEQRYLLPDAHYQRKDLFVEVDSMSGFGLSGDAIAELEQVFEGSPFSNLSGEQGIKLHILIDDQNLPHVEFWETADKGCMPREFNMYRDMFYGTGEELGRPDSVQRIEAKKKAYRYCIVADNSDSRGRLGCGPIGADEFVVFLGVRQSTGEDEAAIFMHELGHSLGLRHGGSDDILGKSNYPSVMNYVFVFRQRWSRLFWELDYSRADAGQFAALNETMLDEYAGIGTPTGHYRDIWMPFGVSEDDGSGNLVRDSRLVQLNGSEVDFGSSVKSFVQDMQPTTDAKQDLNYIATGPGVPPGMPSSPSYPEMLTPHDDWSNIILQLSATRAPVDQMQLSLSDEPNADAVEWMNQNIDPPPGTCVADFNGDEELNFFDASAFLVAYLDHDPIADLNQDRQFNFFDVSDFLVAYGEGCP